MWRKLIGGIAVAFLVLVLVGTLVYAYIPLDNFTWESIEHSDYDNSYMVVQHQDFDDSLMTIDMGSPIAAPTNFTAVISGQDIILNWTATAGSSGTLIRRGEDAFPANTNEGELIYRGHLEAATDLGRVNETVYNYYSAWAYDTVNYSFDNVTAATGGLPMIFLGILALATVGLTVGGFAVKQNVIIIIAALFWFLMSAMSLTLSTATWDIYYLVFWSGMFIGVVVFSGGLLVWRRGRSGVADYTDDYDDMDAYQDDLDDDRKEVNKYKRLGKRKKKKYFPF